MSTLASVHIETWDGKFVVLGQFDGLIEIPRLTFATYGEALKEMAKIVQREELRYASRSSNYPYR